MAGTEENKKEAYIVEDINSEDKKFSFSNKYILIVALIVLAINAIVIDILYVSSASSKKLNNNVSQSASEPICSQSCIDQFSSFSSSNTNLSSSSASSFISPPVFLTPTLTITPTPTQSPTPTPTSTPHEYFVPLGAGSGNYTSWTVIPGIGANISVVNYGSIEKVYFEVTVRVPAGSQTVSVRLYNANSQQEIANSEIDLNGGTATLLTSSPITLTQTTDQNLYEVQLKTQLGATTYVDQARLHIFAK